MAAVKATPAPDVHPPEMEPPPPLIRQRFGDGYYHLRCAPDELRQPEYEATAAEAHDDARCHGCGHFLRHSRHRRRIRWFDPWGGYVDEYR